MQKQTIYAVDDDRNAQGFLFTFLSVRGYQVECFDSGEQLLSRFSARTACGLVLLDVVMPGCDGVDVIRRLRAMGSSVPVIMLSGMADIRTVVDSMQSGATDFLLKPFDETVLEAIVKDLFAGSATGEMKSLQAAAEDASRRDFLTANPSVLQIAGIVRRVAYTDVPILILGESGVGKEVMARFAHRHSSRADKPFIKINCAALPHELLESELFGYERGAFTGALNDKVGQFELADGGTLLLDEIGEMSAHLQSKMLHVLQDGSFSRLGGRKTIHVDVRIIAATNIKLEEAIASGKFREDLYYRLNVVRVSLPPLRERTEDIPVLCQHFVDAYREKYKSPVTAIPSSLLGVFSTCRWPGNIRQLENIVKQYLLLQNPEEITRELCPERPLRGPQVEAAAGTPRSLLSVGAAAADLAERQLVQRVLEETAGNRKKAAQKLNICYKALLNKLKRWNGSVAETVSNAS